jgi:hypothetical protein
LNNPPKDFVERDGRLAAYFKIHGRIDNRRGDNCQCAMLIPIIDGLDLPEKPCLRQLPAMVRLYTFDDFDSGAVHSGHTPFLGLKELTGTAQRELNRALFSSARSCQGENQMIKRGTKIVGDFAQKQRNTSGKGLDGTKMHDQPVMTVWLRRDYGVKIRTQKSGCNSFKRFGTFLRSSDFPTNLALKCHV